MKNGPTQLKTFWNNWNICMEKVA